MEPDGRSPAKLLTEACEKLLRGAFRSRIDVVPVESLAIDVQHRPPAHTHPEKVTAIHVCGSISPPPEITRAPIQCQWRGWRRRATRGISHHAIMAM